MHALCQRYSLSAVLLFTACIASIVLPLQADERPDTRANIAELDSEIQAIKTEIVNINRDILLLEESTLHSQGGQLVVLVSVTEGSPVVPEQISLRLNGQSLSHHNYSGSEGAALLQGGVHRLYAGRVNEGEYQFDIAVSGRMARGKDFQQQHSVTLRKLPGPKYLELQIGAAESSSKIGVIIREWQQ